MDARMIILGFLIKQPLTGYELKKAFEISLSYFSGLSYGSIYPALKQMESEGLITMELEIQDGAPNKKVYTISEKGREVFREALGVPLPMDRPRNLFLMRLFFFAHLPEEDRLRIAQDYLQEIETVHQTLQATEPEIGCHADFYQLLCFQFGIRFYRDLAANVSQVIESLREGGSPRSTKTNPPKKRKPS